MNRRSLHKPGSPTIRLRLANGRRHIRVRICQNAIEAQARRAEHVGKVAARSGLIAARAQLAAARMSAQARAEALREIDDNIAELDGQGN